MLAKIFILDVTCNRKKLATQKLAQNKKHIASNQCTLLDAKKIRFTIVHRNSSIKRQTVRVEVGDCIIQKCFLVELHQFPQIFFSFKIL